MRAARVQKLVTKLHMLAFKQMKKDTNKTFHKGVAIGLRWAIRQVEQAERIDRQ